MTGNPCQGMVTLTRIVIVYTIRFVGQSSSTPHNGEDMEVTTFEVGGLRIRVMTDENAQDPRENDNVSRMACTHKRYDLGDEKWGIDSSQFDSWDEVQAAIEEEHKPVAILPLSLTDHGGLSMSIGVSRGWDSGQVGFIYVTREALDEAWGAEHVQAMTEQERVETAERCMRAEVAEYDAHLRGEVYRFVIEEPKKCGECKHTEWTEVESLCGFYGYDEVCATAREMAEAIVESRRAKREQYEDAKEVL